MEPNNTNTPPVQPAMPAPHKRVGPIIASLIVVLILVVVALYLFAAQMSQPNAEDTTGQTAANTTASTSDSVPLTPEVQSVTNTADDPQSLQNDLDKATYNVDQQTF